MCRWPGAADGGDFEFEFCGQPWLWGLIPRMGETRLALIDAAALTGRGAISEKGVSEVQIAGSWLAGFQ
jgi:hypothetical protein